MSSIQAQTGYYLQIKFPVLKQSDFSTFNEVFVIPDTYEIVIKLEAQNLYSDVITKKIYTSTNNRKNVYARNNEVYFTLSDLETQEFKGVYYLYLSIKNTKINKLLYKNVIVFTQDEEIYV